MSSNSANNDDDDTPKDPLSEMLAQFLGGAGMENFDAAELAKAAGLPSDPNVLAQLFAQVQSMMSSPSDTPVNWDLAHDAARKAAAGDDPSISPAQAREVDEALRLAEMWLDPVTELAATGIIGKAWSRAEWVEETLGTWQRLTEPVANSIAFAISSAMNEQLPEEMKSMMGGAASMMQNMGGALFGLQLGTAIGALAKEVVGSTDIGIPLADLQMALLPANVKEFGEGLGLPDQEVRLFLALREAAYVRLFVQVPWLRGHLLGTIESYARGIHIDMSRIQDLAQDLDPSNPEAMQAALSGGVFMPARTPEQEAALTKLETALALVEGWVDEVSFAAAANLPSAAAMRETIRRNRATGGPAEHAFGSLVGLELRPRRLREAAALWASLKDQRGIAGRDAIWAHPDLLPTSADLDDAAGFSSRRSAADASDSEVDAALTKLLDGEFEDLPPSSDDVPKDPSADDGSGAEDPGAADGPSDPDTHQ